MGETSAYVEFERNAWSILKHCEMRFRLTYDREFLPVQALWRDFLVSSEEIGPAFAAPMVRPLLGSHEDR
jgi:hypothetical protein